ncbi:DgyrCDS9000 [Dimorphilus gyrociliatus]|uniref:DgyrCDS9000 n=1 Tax=Dimorphilus gyrociliatus TaxID=2664684 RepID=A0A7I8VVR9_9ANNE|nr:DgyrCDS9000 [Dimorphilus gyrociliatus]
MATETDALLGNAHYSPRSVEETGDETISNETGLDSAETELYSLQSKPRTTTTGTQSLMHLLKGNIGTGILAMPAALSYSGIWVGFVLIPILGLVATHCMHLLINAARKLKDPDGENLGYSRVVEEAFRQGPVKFQRFARAIKLIVDTFLCITQFGFCIVYILFISRTLEIVVKAYHPDISINIRVYEILVTLVLIPYTFIGGLRNLSYFSTIANVSTMAGLIGVLVYSTYDLPDVSDYPAFESWSTLPLFFGLAIYAFEGIGLVMPIENKMKYKHRFNAWNGVLNTGMFIVTALYTAVGFFGFLKVGKKVKGSITLNLPSNQWQYNCIQILIALAIFLSYGLQFLVPINIIWPYFRKKLEKRNYSRLKLRWCRYLFKTIVVLSTFVAAAVLPQLNLLISLIGAFSSSSIALIFPPIVDCIVNWPNDLGYFRWKLIKNILIIAFGLFGFAVGTATTLEEIVKAFQSGHIYD